MLPTPNWDALARAEATFEAGATTETLAAALAAFFRRAVGFACLATAVGERPSSG